MTWIAHYGTKDQRLIEVFTQQQDKKGTHKSRRDNHYQPIRCEDYP
jgi:hypothetical protein